MNVHMCMSFVTMTLAMLLCMHHHPKHARVNMWRLHSYKCTVMTHSIIRQVDSIDAGQGLSYKSSYTSLITKSTSFK